MCLGKGMEKDKKWRPSGEMSCIGFQRRGVGRTQQPSELRLIYGRNSKQGKLLYWLFGLRLIVMRSETWLRPSEGREKKEYRGKGKRGG